MGPVPEGRDPEEYDRLRRRLLWALPTGLFVLGSRHEGRRNLMTVSWVTQVATAPKLVAASVEAGSVTGGLVSGSGRFALTMLGRADKHVVRRFVKPAADVDVDEETGRGTMSGEPVVGAPSGVPVLAAAGAWLDCAVRQRVELGSHLLFVGEVTDCGVGAPGAAEADAPGEWLRMEDTRMNYGG
ncbi:MAG: flavin reductase [Acidobacteriota bacterium]|nr:flavin reductase [Acidobacteriota bacterium]